MIPAPYIRERIETMQDLRIATAQFENKDNDKAYNLGRGGLWSELE